MSDLSSTLGEKIQEQQEEPIITSASNKGVTQDESASREGFTKAPMIIQGPPGNPASGFADFYCGSHYFR